MRIDQKVRELAQAGLSTSEICRELCCSETPVRNAALRMGITIPKAKPGPDQGASYGVRAESGFPKVKSKMIDQPKTLAEFAAVENYRMRQAARC